MTEASINLDHELATSELADVCQHGADSVDDVVGVVSMRICGLNQLRAHKRGDYDGKVTGQHLHGGDGGSVVVDELGHASVELEVPEQEYVQGRKLQAGGVWCTVLSAFAVPLVPAQ